MKTLLYTCCIFQLNLCKRIWGLSDLHNTRNANIFQSSRELSICNRPEDGLTLQAKACNLGCVIRSVIK